MVTADGERSFVCAPGCEFAIGAAALANVKPRAADWVLVSGYSLAEPASGAAIADWLARAGGGFPVVFDPSPLVDRIAPDALAALLARADWLTCNGDEARMMTGADDPRDAIRRLARGNAGGVLLRMGARGCLMQQGGAAPQLLPAFKAEAVDTTGAGDTHTGAFIAAAMGGRSPAAAASYANAAAAISVARAGGASAPSRREILEFIDASDSPTGSVAPHLGVEA
jgi:sugar/nucleoside kinase (ribokinase family)